jgi:hypothetical protein
MYETHLELREGETFSGAGLDATKFMIRRTGLGFHPINAEKGGHIRDIDFHHVHHHAEMPVA